MEVAPLTQKYPEGEAEEKGNTVYLCIQCLLLPRKSVAKKAQYPWVLKFCHRNVCRVTPSMFLCHQMVLEPTFWNFLNRQIDIHFLTLKYCCFVLIKVSEMIGKPAAIFCLYFSLNCCHVLKLFSSVHVILCLLYLKSTTFRLPCYQCYQTWDYAGKPPEELGASDTLPIPVCIR